MNNLMGAYCPKSSPIHRAPLWSKWLVIFGITLTCAITHTWWVPALALMLVLVLALGAGLSLHELGAALWSVKWLLLAMSLYYLLFDKLALGADVLLTLLTLIFATKVLLFTTPTTSLIDGFVRGCKPLRGLGVSPELVGLAIALMLRSIPVIMDRWVILQTAVKARGIKLSAAHLFTPLVMTTVAYAHETGDAIVARGLDSPKNKQD